MPAPAPASHCPSGSPGEALLPPSTKPRPLLRELGCDYAQGYFISKPVGPSEFFELATGFSDSRRVA
jgi:hypothetical protein